MTDDELNKLKFIRERYGELIRAAAARHRHRPEVVAGIMMRETEGGLSKWLDKPGPAGRGDLVVETKPDGTKVNVYHGHGLMQIDDRSFADYCAGPNWKEPAGNIDFGCRILAAKRAYLTRHLELSDGEAERAAIAAYNCGEGNVRKALEAGADVDLYSANHDYSRGVLAFAEAYRGLAAFRQQPEPAPIPSAPKPPQAASAGFWATMLGWLMKIFVKRSSP